MYPKQRKWQVEENMNETARFGFGNSPPNLPPSSLFTQDFAKLERHNLTVNPFDSDVLEIADLLFVDLLWLTSENRDIIEVTLAISRLRYAVPLHVS